jgi:PleD family two-component response regulator
MAKNILICDDAAFMRMMIKDILTKKTHIIFSNSYCKTLPANLNNLNILCIRYTHSL